MAAGMFYKHKPKAAPKKANVVVSVKAARSGKSSKRRRSLMSKSLFKNPFPSGKVYKLTYSDTTDLTGTGTAAPAYFQVRANSPYDPDQTGAGHQPRYYDTLFGADNTSAPYRQYRVLSAKIRVDYFSQGATVANLGDGAVQVCKVGTQPFSTNLEMREGANSKIVTIGSGYSANGIRTLTYNLSSKVMARLLGIKDIKDDEDLVADYNANPGAGINFNVYWSPIQAASAGVCTVRWTVTYRIEAINLNDVATS